jgi:hypothetical protein
VNLRTVGKCHFCGKGSGCDGGTPPLVTVEAPSGIVRICRACAAEALRLLSKRETGAPGAGPGTSPILTGPMGHA